MTVSDWGVAILQRHIRTRFEPPRRLLISKTLHAKQMCKCEETKSRKFDFYETPSRILAQDSGPPVAVQRPVAYC